jgi:glucose-6-phosphate 1-dehydrogenase
LARAADTLVIFGISGDLAKKMTFQALYRLEHRGDLDCRVIGVAIDEWDDDALRRHARESIEATAEGEIDEKALESVLGRLSYVQGDYAKPETYAAVKDAVGDDEAVVYYLEIPPSLFGTVIRGLGDAGLTEGARFVVEKPFGHDPPRHGR